MITLTPNRLDEERTGDIVMGPTARLYEIIVFNQALDICALEALNMEGGRAGRRTTIRASAMVAA